MFSKYVWIVPLKTKTGPSLVEAFKIILASGRNPGKIITDQGTEFFNGHIQTFLDSKDNYHTFNETKPGILRVRSHYTH